jgi:hypothetical protein
LTRFSQLTAPISRQMFHLEPRPNSARKGVNRTESQSEVRCDNAPPKRLLPPGTGAVRHMRLAPSAWRGLRPNAWPARTLLFSCLAALIVLTGCGSDDEPSPPPTSTVAPPPASPESLPEGAMLVSQLADEIASAWPAVTSFRTTTSTTTRQPGMATPAAGINNTQSFEEVIVPDRRRRVVSINGELLSELLMIDGAIFGRGPEIPGLPSESRDPDTWVRIELNELGAEGQFRSFYETFLTTPAAPYSALTEQERSRIANLVEPASNTNGNCAVYQIADTTMTGERYDIYIAVNDEGLPCFIETQAAGTTAVTTFEYGLDLQIEMPEGVSE